MLPQEWRVLGLGPAALVKAGEGLKFELPDWYVLVVYFMLREHCLRTQPSEDLMFREVYL